MNRVEHIAEGVALHLGDCRDVLPTLSAVGAVVSDPPYGMKWNTNSKRFTGGTREKQLGPGRDDWGAVAGDHEPFNAAPWIGFSEVILWGANHYAAALPLGTTLIWLKKHPHLLGTYLSDAEIGWQRGGHGVYVANFPFPNTVKVSEGFDGLSLHPTQKPLALMDWCIRRVKSPEILDPYMGSGTTGVAAVKLGRRFQGIEIEQKYFDIACKRIEAATRQPDMFVEAPAPATQVTFAEIWKEPFYKDAAE